MIDPSDPRLRTYEVADVLRANRAEVERVVALPAAQREHAIDRLDAGLAICVRVLIQHIDEMRTN